MNESREQVVSELEALINFAEVQFFQAGMAGKTERGALIAQAKDALFRVEKVRKGGGSWLLARICASDGNAELCVKWLNRAQDNGALPDKNTMEKDPHLKSVCNSKEFKKFMRGMNT